MLCVTVIGSERSWPGISEYGRYRARKSASRLSFRCVGIATHLNRSRVESSFLPEKRLSRFDLDDRISIHHVG